MNGILTVKKDKAINFIGIGAQKCGTTWIHRNLAAHPKIYVASGKDKDTGFFTCYYDRGYQYYESLFSDAGEDALAGEVSTSYFYDSDAPLRIKNYNPDIKLFVCLRNPVERIISNHRHEARAGRIWGNNLSLAAAIDNNPAYLLQSRYAKHLKHWYSLFDRDNIKVLLFDDLCSKPQQFMSDIYQFIGVDDRFVPEELEQRANVARIPSSQKVERIILRSGWLLRKAGFSKLVAFGRNSGINDWLRKANTMTDESVVVEVSDDAIDRIKHELQDDVNNLSSLIGRDMSSLWF